MDLTKTHFHDKYNFIIRVMNCVQRWNENNDIE